MKTFFTACLVACALTGSAQVNNHPFYTSGNKILDPCGNEFVMKGVNYSLVDDWDFPGNMNNGELSSQIIQANPNTVRIEWYVDYGQPARPAYALSDLDSVVSRFKRAGILSIIELHDVTCSDDYAKFNNVLVPWCTSPPVVALINKHKNNVMLNFANEFGKVNWAGNPNAELVTWTNTYKAAITAVRATGVDVPLMIDAPDCGTSLDRILEVGAALNTHDNLNRIIMSAHAYWYTYTPAQMNAAVQSMKAATFPVILGEVANVQDATAACSHTIPVYTDLLQSCETLGAGWLAWTWTDDMCADRRISPDGMIANLTTFGNNIVNSANYGLKAKAQKACFSTTSVADVAKPSLVSISPNPNNGMVTLVTARKATLRLVSVTGQLLQIVELNADNNFKAIVTNLPQGITFIQSADGEIRERIVTLR